MGEEYKIRQLKLSTDLTESKKAWKQASNKCSTQEIAMLCMSRKFLEENEKYIYHSQ